MSQATCSQNSQRSSIFNSPEERKSALRKNLNRASILQQDASPTALKNLEMMVDEVDVINDEIGDINRKVDNHDQILIDSEMMAVSSLVIRCCMKSLDKGLNAYSKSEFAEKLIQHVHRLPNETMQETNWSLLERTLVKLFKKTPDCCMLLNAMNPVIKPERTLSIQEAESKVLQRRLERQREAKIEVKRPENVTTVEKEESSVDETVEKLRRFIKAKCRESRQGIEFFHLILNPHDFGKTIENLLHLSFIVRDGAVKLVKDDEGTLFVVRASDEVREEAQKRGNAVNIQNVMNLNYEQWKLLKDVYRLEEPMLNF